MPPALKAVSKDMKPEVAKFRDHPEEDVVAWCQVYDQVLQACDLEPVSSFANFNDPQVLLQLQAKATKD